MAEIRPNRVKRRLAEGGVVTVPAGVNTPDMIDEMGPMGFDGFWIEAEHGPVDFGDIADLTRACDIWGVTSIVRVNHAEPGLIYRNARPGSAGLSWCRTSTPRTRRGRSWTRQSLRPSGTAACSARARDLAWRTT